jgi:hypothetical protein
MAAALLQRSEPGVEDTPDGLERQLRLGLVEPARSRLAAMAEDETRAAACRAEAARALARWSFGAGDMATARACLTSWARANSELPRPEARATAWEIALIDAWCADALGARNVALDRLHDLRAAGERLTDIDFAIAHCHRDTPSDWAARIDRLYRDLGLPGAFAAPDADAGCPASAPLVSVVVMDRPGAHGVEPALESLRAQTWTALDVMVVDRSDSAEERARLGALAASDARIRILSLPGDTDDCTARDHALGLARGRYVTVHRGDLLSHPMRIELQLEPLLDGDVAASLCEGVRVTPDRRLIPSWETAFRVVVPQPDSLLVDRDALRALGIAGRPLADSLEKAGHTPETVLAGLPLTLAEVTDARPQAEPVAYDTVFIATLAPDAPALPTILTRIRTEARSGRSVGVFHWPDATAQSPAPDAGVLKSLIGDEVGLIRPHGAARAVRVVLCHPFAVLQPVAGLPDFRPERLEVLGGPELHAPPPGPMPRPRHLPSDEVYEAMFGAPPVRIAV